MKRLNAYLFTDTFIREGLAFLGNAIVPQRFQYESRKNEFRARYAGMHALSGILYAAARQIVPLSQIDATLSALYKAIGDIGRDRFYAHIAAKYVGISRPRVQQFLNNQELHRAGKHAPLWQSRRPRSEGLQPSHWKVGKYKNISSHPLFPAMERERVFCVGWISFAV